MTWFRFFVLIFCWGVGAWQFGLWQESFYAGQWMFQIGMFFTLALGEPYLWRLRS